METQAEVPLRPTGSSRRYKARKPRRSLRTILLIWFLLLSLVPLMFVTGYSLIKYEQAIDNELVQRLRANVREISVTISDYEKYLLSNRRQRLKADTSLVYYISTNAGGQAKQHLQGLLRSSYVSHVSIFNRDGLLMASLTRDEANNFKENHEIEGANIYLADAYKATLDKSGQMDVVDNGSSNSMDLIALTRLDTKSGRVAGYIEEIIAINPTSLENFKKRLNLEIMLFDSRGNIIAGSHPDFLLYQKDYFANMILGEKETFFDLTVRNEPFGFIISPVKWGNSNFLIGLGASKHKAKAVLRNINFAFFTVIGAIGILLVFTSIVTARAVLRPLNELVDAIQKMDVQDAPMEIPVKSETELGVLTESFNEMSQRIYNAKVDLENKVRELEKAYSEVKDAQAQLVHSAKMASLGQLVAGIAHELNNPIGFIYSNMGHLRDYSTKLNQIIEAAGKDPQSLAKIKEEVDYEYIVQDLPRLISSCEEGARRTRDIVLGLRNFSRLEEAKIKKVDLREGIENTLRLIAGEVKGRIEVHTDFKPMPHILCYASQLNQVFMNILANAAQAIEGEGHIWIELSLLQEPGQPDRARVVIRDSGKGMPSETLEKIFDPFFTTKGVGQGTGLGLSISYGIVKKHGGDIQVHSEAGKGTEFIVTIPVDGPPGADALPA
jgi:two-component system NtrC family sensor kinase